MRRPEFWDENDYFHKLYDYKFRPRYTEKNYNDIINYYEAIELADKLAEKETKYWVNKGDLYNWEITIRKEDLKYKLCQNGCKFNIYIDMGSFLLVPSWRQVQYENLSIIIQQCLKEIVSINLNNIPLPLQIQDILIETSPSLEDFRQRLYVRVILSLQDSCDINIDNLRIFEDRSYIILCAVKDTIQKITYEIRKQYEEEKYGRF